MEHRFTFLCYSFSVSAVPHYLCLFFLLPHGAEWAHSSTSRSPGSRAGSLHYDPASWPGQCGGNLSV